MDDSCSKPAPVLRSETACALLVAPAAVLTKVKLVGLSVTEGVGGGAPVPLRDSERVAALLRISTEAVREPVAVGRNTTEIEHVPFAATVALHPCETEKSAA
jgi:hypothetical protein